MRKVYESIIYYDKIIKVNVKMVDEEILPRLRDIIWEIERSK